MTPLKKVFKKVDNLGLTADQYLEVITIITDWGIHKANEATQQAIEQFTKKR